MDRRKRILICGGGIIGLTLARSLLRAGYRRITILEKELGLGRHASGRNSGVLHGGIYYGQGSWKARFCLLGNRMMRSYCRERRLPLLECGKVIVARDRRELERLEGLYWRARENGAEVRWLSERELERREPYARTYRKALYSPWTASIDPVAVLGSLAEELISSGYVEIHLGTCWRRSWPARGWIETNRGGFSFDILVNAAGANALALARSFGLGREYICVPFKGSYFRLRRPDLVRGHIYPVPPSGVPFLGVHFSRGIDGEVYVGPSSFPSWGLENYRERVVRETFFLLGVQGVLFCRNSFFRSLAWREVRKFIPFYFWREARGLLPSLGFLDLLRCSKVGIRPQLIYRRSWEFVMDFLVLSKGNSLHILNAVSPGFTCSMAFADFLVRSYFE